MTRLMWAIVAIVTLGAIQYLRPLPHPTLQPMLPSVFRVPGPAPQLPWPTSGEGALAVDGIGLLQRFGPGTPTPIASLAKIMTALVVLQHHPLAAGQSGPSLVVTGADVALYRQDQAQGQSVVKVRRGETLTERQLLEGLLIPSGNNFATMLARWVAGDPAAFVADMNAEAKSLGLRHTRYRDASGVSSATVSTAVDQVAVAEKAMAIPVFRHIVRMPQVVLPVAGKTFNVNYFLGKSGIIGIKTGTTLASGGCYVFAAKRPVGHQTALIIGAVLGQGGIKPLFTALQAGRALLNAAGHALKPVAMIRRREEEAAVVVPWAIPQRVESPATVDMIGWSGLIGHYRLQPDGLGPSLSAKTRLGVLNMSLGQADTRFPLTLSRAVKAPSWVWRMIRL